MEATKLSSVPASDNDDRLNNLVWNHTGGHLSAQLSDKSWESIYPAEKTVQAVVYSDADARPTTIRTLKNGWRNKPALIVENDGFDAIGAPSYSAVDDALTTKLSLSGGTLTGDVDLHGNINGDNLSSRMLHFTAEGDGAQGQIQLFGTKENPSTAITTVAGDGRRGALFLNADNSVTTARGGVLAEIIASPASTGRLVKQIFSITGNGNGQPITVTFPQKFSAPPIGINAIVNTETKTEGANSNWNRFVCIEDDTTNGGPAVTETQMIICVAWDGSHGGPLRSIRSYKIWFEVTGMM